MTDSQPETLKSAQKWLFKGLSQKDEGETTKAPWWQVMCLTGVDYFSTLGYQPGIAFLAASYLSPLATLVLVLFTLAAALPIYRRVAEVSPHGQGSVAMLEHLLPGWRGKAAVLVLIGFAATDFIITITLSAADAAQHVVGNTFMKGFSLSPMLVTDVLLMILAGIFLLGFREAIGVAIVLVGIYLVLNLVVVCVCANNLFLHQQPINDWLSRLTSQYPSVPRMFLVSMLLFPKLALGLSGFETGVAVMPLVQGDSADTEEIPKGRIKNTRKLLSTAAIIMSFFLIATSLITTMMIPANEFQDGGQANGRALAYLAHQHLGDIFGTVYDISTIAILWFAGASAMAGLINLVPRYLPRYGMAPDWARAMRPLVLVLFAVSLAVTQYFHASVDAQGAAYATGVLVLMASAAVAVTLTDWNKGIVKRVLLCIITLLFIYTTLANVIERPEGLHIASFFIWAILFVSFVSRLRRSTELRISKVVVDEQAEAILQEAMGVASKSLSSDIAQKMPGTIRLVAHHPGNLEYKTKLAEIADKHNLGSDGLVFIEVVLGDASEFIEDVLEVKGERRGEYNVLTCNAVAVPNALSAVLLYLRDLTGKKPHIYLGWTEGAPLLYVLKFVFLGEGETASITREILRLAEKDEEMRPCVHVA
jgi:hypothetical protein